MARRPDSAAKRRRGIALLVIVAVAALAAIAPTSPWKLIEARAFDYLSTSSPPKLAADSPIIVAVDEPSFAEIGLQWPWPRSLHGRLIAALRKAGAKAIGLDIIFAEPSSDPASDTALAAALGPDVTLAGDETLIKTPHADQTMRVEPLPEFIAAGARPGIASIVLDNDGTLRRVPRYPDGFAAVLAEAAGSIVADVPAGALLQTFGPARTFPTASYYQALSPDEFLPKDFFTGSRRHRRAFHAIGARRRSGRRRIPTRPRSRCAAGIWCRARKSRRRSTKTSPGSCISPPPRPGC